MTYSKEGKDGVVREYSSPSSKFDNIVDRTTGEMIGEYLESGYNLIKQSHPECGGFVGIVMELPNGDVKVNIDLLEKPE